jgi:N-acetylmuramoyl-L-alanine amidase
MVQYFSQLFATSNNSIKIIILLLLFNYQAYAQDYQKFKARKGDGIYSVLRENGYPADEYLTQFIELNQSKLGKNNSLIIGKTYKLPLKVIEKKAPEIVSQTNKKKSIFKIYEIFGKKYHEVSITGNELAGAVFYLMSGHGGPDPGAIGYLNGNQLCEDEYAYDVTLRLARNLIERGASVYMIIRDPNDGIRDEQYLTPDKDEVCYLNKSIPLNQVLRLKQATESVNRLNKQNKAKYKRLIVIHVDSRNKNENIDVFFYHKNGSKTGEKLANTLEETFESKYARHQPNRGYEGTVSDRNLFVFKNTSVPSVFIELGNINHIRDQKRLIISDNRQAVANWLREGLIIDYNKSSK